MLYFKSLNVSFAKGYYRYFLFIGFTLISLHSSIAAGILPNFDEVIASPALRALATPLAITASKQLDLSEDTSKNLFAAFLKAQYPAIDAGSVTEEQIRMITSLLEAQISIYKKTGMASSAFLPFLKAVKPSAPISDGTVEIAATGAATHSAILAATRAMMSTGSVAASTEEHSKYGDWLLDDGDDVSDLMAGLQGPSTSSDITYVKIGGIWKACELII